MRPVPAPLKAARQPTAVIERYLELKKPLDRLIPSLHTGAVLLGY